jgi:hypothetical protein
MLAARRKVGDMLTPDRPKWRGYSAKDLQTCAEREANMRRKVYPNRVLTHRMSRHQADRETDMMEAIAGHFAELAEVERLL